MRMMIPRNVRPCRSAPCAWRLDEFNRCGTVVRGESRGLTAPRQPTIPHFGPTRIDALRRCYCLASGAFSTALQTAGSADIGIGGFGFGGTFGGFGWMMESLNQ